MLDLNTLYTYQVQTQELCEKNSMRCRIMSIVDRKGEKGGRCTETETKRERERERKKEIERARERQREKEKK